MQETTFQAYLIPAQVIYQHATLIKQNKPKEQHLPKPITQIMDIVHVHNNIHVELEKVIVTQILTV